MNTLILSKEIFGLRLVNEHAPLKQFLIDNPFIGLTNKNELTGFVLVDKKTFTDAQGNLLQKSF